MRLPITHRIEGLPHIPRAIPTDSFVFSSFSWMMFRTQHITTLGGVTDHIPRDGRRHLQKEVDDLIVDDDLDQSDAIEPTGHFPKID